MQDTQEWEYLIVTFDDDSGRPRYANDEEIPEWETRDLAAILDEWSAQGWELVGQIPVPAPGRIARFRRPRKSPYPADHAVDVTDITP